MTPLAGIAVICALGALGLSFWYVPAYRRYRGKRIVKCPENEASAVVEVDAARYTATSLFEHPTVRLRECSRWPDRASCDQACLPQVATENT